MKGTIAANAFAVVPLVIWSTLFRFETAHFAALPAYGYPDRWDFSVYVPLAMVICLLGVIVTFSIVRRGPAIIFMVAAFALLAVLPFGAMVGGGV